MSSITKIRDISIIQLKYSIIAVTCDSCGAIGNKKNDIVQIDPTLMARETAKVSMAELISIGAEPVMISNGLCVEMHPTGGKIIQGIQMVIDALPDYNIGITGSTEDNIPTSQTGIGLTTIGTLDSINDLKINFILDDYIIALIGIPLFGEEFARNINNVLTITDYYLLRGKKYIKDLVPVGSKGILYEINSLCKISGYEYRLKDKIDIDLEKSAGSSTCCIVTISKEDVDKLASDFRHRIITLLAEVHSL
jgi:hypothetical protein